MFSVLFLCLESFSNDFLFTSLFISADGYGVYLAEITVDQRLDLPLRQLASVMLKQYVEQSWVLDLESEDLLKPVASDQAKKVIKSILPEALYDPNSKVRALKLNWERVFRNNFNFF